MLKWIKADVEWSGSAPPGQAHNPNAWIAHAFNYTLILIEMDETWTITARETDPEAVGTSVMFGPMGTREEAEGVAQSIHDEIAKCVN